MLLSLKFKFLAPNGPSSARLKKGCCFLDLLGGGFLLRHLCSRSLKTLGQDQQPPPHHKKPGAILIFLLVDTPSLSAAFLQIKASFNLFSDATRVARNFSEPAKQSSSLSVAFQVCPEDAAI